MSDKYPRTPHLPWSSGVTDGDKRLPDVADFVGPGLVITEKVDGSNVCMTREHVFARSHAAMPTHPSFSYAKSLHSQLRDRIPQGKSLFGEYCYAVHSIEYSSLPGYFLVFGIREDAGALWLSWDEVQREAERLQLPTVAEIWRGAVADARHLERLTLELGLAPSNYGGTREGLVVRVFGRFTEFSRGVAKWVRKDHVQAGAEHWMNRPVRRNSLRVDA